MSEQEMQEEIARLTAENEKLKGANDRLSAENAQKKRDLEARMTEDEKRKAADDERNAQFEALLKENNRYKRRAELQKTWSKNIADPAIVDKVVELSLEDDYNGVSATIAEYYKAREEAIKTKKAQEDMAKDQTPPPASGDNANKDLTYYMSRGEKGLQELDKLATENPALYNKILGND